MNVARANQIPGWMSLDELRFLAERAKNKKLIIEAGSYLGRSTRAMADNTAGIIHAIDPWDLSGYKEYYSDRDEAAQSYSKDNGNGIFQQFMSNLFDHVVDQKVIPHPQEFHSFILYNPDMIFIDANHEYAPVKRDVLHALSLMYHGGLLCGHDYRGEWPGVIRAVDEIFGAGIQTCESIWWIKL